MRPRLLLWWCLVLTGGLIREARPATVFFQEPATTRGAGVGGVNPATGMPGLVGGGGAAPASRQEDLQEQFRRRVQELQQKQQQATRPGGVPGQSGLVGTPGKNADIGSMTRSGPGVKLNYNNAPIDRVVNAVMQELGYSYVIDPAVQGTVTIFSMREIPREHLFGVLEQLLKMNGHAIVKQGDFYTILPLGQSPTIPHGVLMSTSGQTTGSGPSQPTPSSAPSGTCRAATGRGRTGEPAAGSCGSGTASDQDRTARSAPGTGRGDLYHPPAFHPI
jgi:hypothetical protein